MLIKVEHKQLHEQNDETAGICFVEPCAEMIPDVSGNVYNREKSEILLKGTLRSSGDQKIRWPNYSTIQTLKNSSLQRWWKVGGSFVVHSIFLELHRERALQRSPEQLKRRRTLKKKHVLRSQIDLGGRYLHPRCSVQLVHSLQAVCFSSAATVTI